MTAVDDAVATRAFSFTPTLDRSERATPAAPVRPVPRLDAHEEPLRAAAVAPRASDALVTRKQWEKRYRARLGVTDGVIVLLACMLATVATLLITRVCLNLPAHRVPP